MQFHNNMYQFENLSAFKKIRHGVSSRAFGSMKNEDFTIDCDNLKKFREAIGISERAVCMDQVHSGTVAVITDDHELVISKTDGLITNKKHLPLAVITADCLPILFYDSKKEVIAVVHAGYRGLLKNIIHNTIERLRIEFGTGQSDLIVGIGPAIERDCYEVGKEVIDMFTSQFPEFENIYVQRDGKYFLDTRSVGVQNLETEGVLQENIEVMDLCTKCGTETLYSFRGGDATGRFASVVSLN